MNVGRFVLNRHTSPLLLLIITIPMIQWIPNGLYVSESLTTTENSVLALVNSTEAWSYATQLEDIALSHLAFRAAGSVGAKVTAELIVDQFQGFGLEVTKEEFQFTSWDLRSRPTLVVDDDGNLNTAADQTVIGSFQCEHYSWPGNEFAGVVVLPLPPAENNGMIGAVSIGSLWDNINTTGKIVLVGREVRSSTAWQSTFVQKLHDEPPAAVIHTWWYSWMAFVPDFFSSTGGRPVLFSHYFWELGIPVGFVNYDDGLLIRSKASLNASAAVVVDAVTSNGTHFNVVGKLNGCKEPNKSVIVCAHYDSVMSAGFCDNAAGVAGVVELAHVLTEAVNKGIYCPRYNILFIGLTGEELGLVGSIEYVAHHKADMQNVVAVINLDCLGNRDLEVTETQMDHGINLCQIVLAAAADIGLEARMIGAGQSDETSFLSPSDGDAILINWWDTSLNIGDAHAVRSSVMISSSPLFYQDLWGTGAAGWIHTSYDNSTSSATLGWVEPQNLEAHIKVATLTALRVVPSTVLLTDVNRDGSVNILDVSIVAAAFRTIPSDALWNPVADLNEDGVINIVDLSMVAKDFGRTV
jgi:hypothetical protein